MGTTEASLEMQDCQIMSLLLNYLFFFPYREGLVACKDNDLKFI